MVTIRPVLQVVNAFKRRNSIAFVCFLATMFLGTSAAFSQVILSLTSTEKDGRTTLKSGELETIQLNYAVSSTTGNARGVKLVVNIPDNIYDIRNFAGTVHAPATNFVFSNVPGAKKLTITFIDPIASGSSGVLEFGLMTNNLITPNNTVLSTTAELTANGGYTSGVKTQSVTVTAAAAICATKSLLRGGAVDNFTTYRIMVNPGYNIYGWLSKGSLLNTNVCVVDTLPAGATFVSAKVYNHFTRAYVSDGTISGGVVTANLPDLSLIRYGDGIGQIYDVDIIVKYEAAFSVGDVVINRAIVKYTPAGGSPAVLTDGQNIGGACTTDLYEKIVLQPPTVGGSITKSPLYMAASTVYPGNRIGYSIDFTNTGNIALDSVTIIDNIPSTLRLDLTAENHGVRFDSWAGYIQHGEYQTNLSSGWVVLPNSTSPNFPASLPAGEYITKIKLVLKSPFPANTSLPVYNILYFVPALEVNSRETVSNCIEWNSTTPGIPTQTMRTACNTYYTLEPRPSTSKIMYNAAASPHCGGNMIIGQTATFIGDASTDIGYSDAINPVCALMIPAGFNYVPGSVVFDPLTSGIVAQPTLQIVPNYGTYGSVLKDMYRFTFPVGTVFPKGTSFRISVQATSSSTLTAGVLYNCDFIATAANSSVNFPTYNYGNITDTQDWDLDGNTTETIGRSNSNNTSCDIVLSSNASMQSIKWVKGQLDSVYTRYPDFGITVPGGNADYKLIVKNTGNVLMKNIKLIDILPFITDRGVIDPNPRLSAWRPNLAGAIAAPSGVTVYYSTESNPCRDEVKQPTDPSPYPTGCAVANWSTVPPRDLTKVQSVKIDFGSITIAGGDSLIFSWPMRAPVIAPTNDQIAWNSFAFTATRADNNMPLIPAEPIKVGIKAQPGSPGFYGNMLWYDTNHDGIQDEGEGGVDGVIVKLFTPNIPGERHPEFDALVNFTITGNGGQYLFSNLNAGDYYAVFILPSSPNISPKNATGSTSYTDSDGDPYTYNGTAATITPITYISGSERDLSWDQGIYCPAFFPSITPNVTVKIGNSVTFTASGGTSYEWSGPNGFTASTASITINNASWADTGYYYVTISDGTCDATLSSCLHISRLCTLGDKVWRDDNKNGHQDAGEPGVAGVTVTLYNNAGAVAGSTVTDAYGRYLFDNITAGNYSVGYTLPANYIFTQNVNQGDNGDNTNSDANPITGRTGTYTLVQTEVDLTADAGLQYNVPAQTASVGDKVWLDTDGDGIQSSTEPGVAGIVVTLYNGTTIVATAITDVKGNYLFTDVAPGSNYTIRFNLPPAFEFTTNDQGGDDAADSDPDIYTGVTPAFTVVAGGENLSIDAGIMPNSTAVASLGDFVWNDLNRNGIQDAGEPGIGGVVVNLLDSIGNPILRGDGSAATTVTDAFGNYQFNNLPTGTYIVEFVKPAGFSISAQLVGTNTAVDNNANPTTGRTNVIKLYANNRITTVDAGMYNNTITPGSTASIGDKVWRDDNKDGMQDTGEPGVAGITVTLYNSLGVAIAVTSTDAFGNYIFVDVLPGAYSVGFSNIPKGMIFTQPDIGGDDTVNSDADPYTGRTPFISVAAGENYTDLDAGLLQGIPAGKGSIGDKVWYDLNNNGLQETGEAGVPNVTVTLNTTGADGIPGNGDDVTIGTTTTNALGQYMFGGLDAGNYYVTFSSLPAGFVLSPAKQGNDDNIDSDGSSFNGGPVVSGVYTLHQGDDILTIDLGLYNPSLTDNNTLGDFVWLDVNSNGVQDATEPGIPGVQVTLLDNAGVPVLIGGNPVVTTSDANGLYLFTGLPDGIYGVAFSNLPAGFSLTTHSATNTANGSDADELTGKTSVVPLSGNTVDLSLDAGLVSIRATLGNYVWNDINANGIQEAGEPGISGATVTLYESNGIAVLATAITGADGGYLFTNLNPGNYVVGVTTLPDNVTFTVKDATDEAFGTDSDINPASGKTDPVSLSAGEVNLNVDAGVKTDIPASVGDYVWIDKDKDGLQGPTTTEPGAAGVLATLYDNTGNPVGAAVSGGKGNYLISNVTPGTGYYIVFSNIPSGASYTIRDIGGSIAEDNSNPDASGATGPFDLASGQNITEIDAGVIDWPNNTVVPLTLLTFTANKLADAAQLKWSTAQEINSDYIQVERSSDGGSYKALGRVNAMGNTSVVTNYYFNDPAPLQGNNYYRLKMVSRDGAAQYSQTRILKFDKDNSIAVYPNPAQSQMSIVLPKTWVDKEMNVQLFNQMGQIVFSKNIRQCQQTEVLQFGTLADGNYVLKLQQPGQPAYSKKIQLKR